MTYIKTEFRFVNNSLDILKTNHSKLINHWNFQYIRGSPLYLNTQVQCNIFCMGIFLGDILRHFFFNNIFGYYTENMVSFLIFVGVFVA
jgi:hypothetical protein